jgi:hypothetical protein
MRLSLLNMYYSCTLVHAYSLSIVYFSTLYFVLLDDLVQSNHLTDLIKLNHTPTICTPIYIAHMIVHHMCTLIEASIFSCFHSFTLILSRASIYIVVLYSYEVARLLYFFHVQSKFLINVGSGF